MENCFFLIDPCTAENAEISSQLVKKDLEMSCFNPLADGPLAKRFASRLSESHLDELVIERHSKKTRNGTNCHKIFWLL